MTNKPCPTLGPTCKGCPDCGRRVSCTSDDITNEAARQELEMCGWLDGANSRANDDRLAQDAAFEGVSLRHRRDGFKTPEASSADLESDLNEYIGQTPAPVWDGEGLPPVGAEFNYGSHRSRAKCLAIGRHYVFASKGDPDDEEGDYEEMMIDATTEFYPVNEVRDQLMQDIVKSAGVNSRTAVIIANGLLAAGYRKQ